MRTLRAVGGTGVPVLAAVLVVAACYMSSGEDDAVDGGDGAGPPDADAHRDDRGVPDDSSADEILVPDVGLRDDAGSCGLADTDGDTIADAYEGRLDSDADTVPNDRDDDADGDTMPDRDEAGTGGDPCNYPRDSDGDTVIDALDFDSDNDGLSDAEEHGRWSTDPANPDSDGDTVTDFGETAWGSDPLDPGSSVDPAEHFVILPYMDPVQHRDVAFVSVPPPQDVTAALEDDPTDLYGMDARAFVEAIEPTGAVPPAGAAGGWDETTFYDVQPGTALTFDVAYVNTVFPPRDLAAAFKVTIVALGEGGVRVGDLTIVVIVPPSGDWVWIG